MADIDAKSDIFMAQIVWILICMAEIDAKNDIFMLATNLNIFGPIISLKHFVYRIFLFCYKHCSVAMDLTLPSDMNCLKFT